MYAFCFYPTRNPQDVVLHIDLHSIILNILNILSTLYCLIFNLFSA